MAPAQSAPIYRQVATHRFFEWVAGIPDPDEVLKRTGRTRADLRALMRDAEVTQALDTRREAVVATPWRLEGAGARAAKFIEGELAPHMPAVIAAAWDAVPYGYSVLEFVYARKAGRIGIGDVFSPPFEWFRPMPDRTLRFFPEDGAGGIEGIPCDPRKFFLTQRNGTYRNPYGEALLSALYWPVTWRMQGWQLWLDFLETFGQPIIVGRTASYEAFIAAMRDQGVKRAIGWQPTSPNEALDTITASSAGEFERLEESLNRTIQRLVLGQTLTSDVGKVGSFAAAKVHNEVREDKRRADVRIVSETMQRIISTMWALNGFPGTAPTFIMQDDVGLERERADRDAILAEKLGIRFTPEYMLERYDLEEGDFTIVEPDPVDPAPGDEDEDDDAEEDQDGEARAAAVARIVAAAKARKFTRTQQVIEREIAALTSTDHQPVPLSKIRNAIAAATDRADLEARLALLVNSRDPKFADLVARAAFAASVIGYVHAAEDAGTTTKE